MIPLGKPGMDEEMKKAAMDVLDSGRYIMGPNIEAFEKEFAQYIGVKQAAAVSSGTAALHLLFLAHGIKPGDEVIIPSASFIATANAVAFVGAKPVFADIDPETYCMSVEATRKAITPKTKAIMPVHLYGHPAELGALKELADKQGIPLIEDACQAHGSQYNGKKIGSIGASAAFSFFPSKNMTVCGDGGMVVTNDDELAERVRMLRNAGRQKSKKYEHDVISFNYRMSELSAAIGRVQLKRLDGWNDARRAAAKTYNQGLKGAPAITALPVERSGARHVYHMYVVRTPHRDALQAHLKEKGVETGIHYPIPIHLQPAYKYLGVGEGRLPQTERWSREVLSLPMFPTITEPQVREVAQHIQSFKPR